jgi:hypothetical protein
VFKNLSDAFAAKVPHWETVHANARFSPFFVSFRGEPRFQKLLRDNMPKYAKPFDDPAIK